MTKIRKIAALLAVSVMAVAGIVATTASPAAASCAYRWLGWAGTITVDGQLAATIKQMYCAANRTAYSELDIEPSFANANSSPWSVHMVTRECRFALPVDCTGGAYSNSSAFVSSRSLVFLGAAMPIDNGVLGDKAFETTVSFVYNGCNIGTYWAGIHDAPEAHSSIHNYHAGGELEVETPVACSSSFTS